MKIGRGTIFKIIWNGLLLKICDMIYDMIWFDMIDSAL